MKRVFMILLICGLFIVTACSGGAETQEPTPIPPTETEKPPDVFYSIKVSADPIEGGAVAPGEDIVLADTSINVEAKCAPGYEFTGWSGASSSTSLKLTVNIDSDKELTAHFAKIVTPTPKPTLTPTTPPCRKPANVTVDDVGEVVEVCGKVTNFGDVSCPECPRGYYGYLKLDKELMFISYYWTFGEDWLGECVLIVDTIELLGNNPVIIFTGGEGHEDAVCTIDETGQRTCTGGFLKPWYDCD